MALQPAKPRAMTIRAVKLAFLGVAVAMLPACQPRHRGEVKAESAWARATAPGQEAGGVFLTIRGGAGQDRLVGGSTPVARDVEIHSMTMDGAVMRMRRQDGVDIPADRETKLEPGGTHLMLVGLKAPLTPGRGFELTLDFAKAGARQAAVQVLPITATGPADDGSE